MALDQLGTYCAFLGWALLWSLGGIWLARRAFNLLPSEQLLTGAALGLALQTWLANLLAHFLAVPATFWLAAVLVFAAGMALTLLPPPPNWRSFIKIPVYPMQVGLLLALAAAFITVGRGLAILDDYQNLPVTSMLATGDIPPHFPLDPNIQFDYHYFTLLFAAQLMRLADLRAWLALDLARGFGFALAILLSAMWVRRVTRSGVAALVSGLMAAFSGGTRWLLLLLPLPLLKQVASQIEMIGSGAQSAPQHIVAMTGDPPFLVALTGAWGVAAGAAWEFPFAFASGIAGIGSWVYHSGTGGIGAILMPFLLLTHNRWRGWLGGIVTAAVLAALALSNEVQFIWVTSGLVGVAVCYAILHKSLRLPKFLQRWLIILLPAGLLASLQGGVLTGVASSLFGRLTGGSPAGSGYFDFSFSLSFPPSVLSSHLGTLHLTNPSQLLVALLEVGPLLLLLPLPVIWGIKAFRSNRWYEAGLVLVAVMALSTLVINYTGNAGPTALNRVQNLLLGVAAGPIGVAATWLWVRQRSERLKAGLGGVWFLSMFSGIVLFGIQLLAVPRPMYSTFIDSLDARMTKAYWNRLEQDALIFDPIPSRAPTVFGRPTNSNITWYVRKPAWQALSERPALADLRAAGFTHVYLDLNYWQGLEPEIQQQFSDPCVELIQEYRMFWQELAPESQQQFRDPYVELIQEYRMPDPEYLTRETFRRLLDIRACGQ